MDYPPYHPPYPGPLILATRFHSLSSIPFLSPLALCFEALKDDICQVRVKRALTIFVLIVFLLNAVGLYGVLIGLQYRFASEAEKKLDEDRYSSTETITFQVPLAIPYAQDEQDYHRVTGEFEHDGDVYRLVKQKLQRDTLYIVCIKDAESKKINQALADCVKTFTDRPQNPKQQGSKLIYSILKDFINTGIAVENDAAGWRECFPYNDLADQYSSSHAAKIKYPPKF